MAMRGAARVERVARCGSAGLRPAAPVASATRIEAVFIVARDLCVCAASRRLTCSPAAGRLICYSPVAQHCRLICSPVMLSGSLRRSIATIAASDRFGSVYCL